MNQRVVSSHFPYLQLEVRFGLQPEGSAIEVEALVDTGFDGHLLLPVGFIDRGEAADGEMPWLLADGREVLLSYVRGSVSLPGWQRRVPALIFVLGDEAIVGRAFIERFWIALDHGQRVIVEP